MLGIAVELRSTTRCTRRWSSSSPSISCSSLPRWTASATTATSCGTRRTGSSTTCCGCPAARRSGSRCVRSSGCCRCAERRSCPSGGVAVSEDLSARLRRASTPCPSCWRRFTTLAEPGVKGRRMLAVLDETKLRRILARMLDEDEILGPHGLGAVSRYHADHPFRFDVHGQLVRGGYLPAESDSGMFGGNSNWRGPGVVPRQLPHPPRAAAPVRLLRRRLHRGVPDRLRPSVHPVRGRHRARAAADGDLPPRPRRPPAGATAAASGSTATPTGRTSSCCTSTSTAITAPGSVPATRPAGPGSSPE